MAIPAISRFKISKVYQKVRQEVHHEVCRFIVLRFSDNNNFVSPTVVLSRGRIHYLLKIV